MNTPQSIIPAMGVMPQSKEEDFKSSNAFSVYYLYGHALPKNPAPVVMKFTFWSSYLYTYFACSLHGRREKDV